MSVITGFSDLFRGAIYNELHGSLPSTKVDKRLLNQSPVVAKIVLREAHQSFLDGLTPGVVVWQNWLHWFRRLGPADPSVAISLAGLIWLRHEARHHLDFFSTPYGTTHVAYLEQEYGYICRLSELPSSESPAAKDILDRLQRLALVRRSGWGRVEKFQSDDWVSEPAFSKQLSIGKMRARSSADAPNAAVWTLSIDDDHPERVISLHTILETRAIIETCLHIQRMLDAAGAAPEEISTAVEILAANGIDRGRDDYWGLFAALATVVHSEDASGVILGRANQVLAAGWFALHSMPITDRALVVQAPVPRFLVALHHFVDPEAGLEPIDWNASCERLNRDFLEKGGVQNGANAPSLHIVLSQSLDQTQRIANGQPGPTGEVVGQVSEHLRGLARCSKDFLLHRIMTGPEWIDEYSLAPEADPMAVTPFYQAPDTQLKIRAARRLQALRICIDRRADGEAFARAKELVNSP